MDLYNTLKNMDFLRYEISGKKTEKRQTANNFRCLPVEGK
jgi:hypothetical protein